MKRLLLFLLAGIMLLQCACVAVQIDSPEGALLSDDEAVRVNAETVKNIYTSEYAYVRGGAEWRDKNWHDILAERGKEPMLIMKNGKQGGNVTRLALLKFDVSGLKSEDVGSASLALRLTDVSGGGVPFEVYYVGSNWSEATVTYSTQPQKLSPDPVASNVVFKNTKSETADVTSAVKYAVDNGEQYVTFMLLQVDNTEIETKMEFSQIAEKDMPHLIVNSEGASATPDIKIDEGVKDVKSFSTTEYAYVRGGSYKTQNWRSIDSKSDTLFIKNGLWTNDVARLGLFKFDLSGLEVQDVGFAELRIQFQEIQQGQTVHFNVYLVEDNWSSDNVTWNSKPQKLNDEPVISNAVFGTLAKVDVTEFVEDMLFDGKTKFSLMLVQIEETDTVTKISVKSESTRPQFRVYKEKIKNEVYTKKIVGNEAENKAIWDNAKQMFDEWYARYLVVKEKPLGNPDFIDTDNSEFGITVMSPGSNPSSAMVARPTRTVDQLKGFEASTGEAKLDTYGGLMDNSMRQEITGFYYTKKIGDRWWVIDPLGYPCVLKCVSGVTVSYQKSPTQKNAVLSKFGNSERWAIFATRRLKDDLGFNSTSTSDQEIYDVVDGLSYFKRFNVANGYASLLGINAGEGGQSKFAENNTMPLFDPAFVDYADERVKANAVPNDERVIAYITDNELPVGLDMLLNYLTLDPTKAVNRYSYATAWYWITQMTGKENITQEDLTDELKDLFRAFVWDRYYYVVTAAIEKYDSNHMYAGTKYLNWVKESEWVLRFSAEYVDILTINWYSAWEPQADFIYAFAKYANVPFMVTEFYAKSSQTFDNLACKDGAGFFVKTQAERGLFYQNYTLRLLEAKNCVGWQWFQYTDNDPAGNPTDISSRDANKGIVNNKHEEYTELTDDMMEINNNVYELIKYFDAR